MDTLLKKFYCFVCKIPTFVHESKNCFSTMGELIIFHTVSQRLLTKEVPHEHAVVKSTREMRQWHFQRLHQKRGLAGVVRHPENFVRLCLTYRCLSNFWFKNIFINIFWWRFPLHILSDPPHLSTHPTCLNLITKQINSCNGNFLNKP